MSRRRIRDVASAPESQSGANLEVPNARGFIALLEVFRAMGGTVPGEMVCRL